MTKSRKRSSAPAPPLLAVLLLFSVTCASSQRPASHRNGVALSSQAALHSDYSTAFVIADPVPHLERLDSALQKRGLSFFEPGALDKWRKVPSEIAGGMTATGISGLDALLRATMLGLWTAAAVGAGEQDDANLCRGMMIDSLDEIRDLDGILWARFRSKEEALTAFTTTRDSLAALGSIPGIEVRARDQQVTVEVSLGKATADPEILAVLVETEVLPSLDHPDGPKLVAALRKLSFTAQLALDQDRLQLVFGKLRQGNGSSGEPKYVRHDSTIFWARWNFGGVQASEKWKRLVEVLSKTSIWNLESEYADPLDVMLIAQNMDALSESGVARLDWKADALAFVMESRGLPQLSDLTAFEGLAFANDDLPVLHIAADSTLMSPAADLVERIESRADMRDLRSTFTSDSADGGPTPLDIYYQQFETFRELVLFADDNLFVGPALHTLTGQGQLRAATLKTSDGEVPLPRAMPFPEYAALARATDPEGLREHYRQACEALFNGVSGFAEIGVQVTCSVRATQMEGVGEAFMLETDAVAKLGRGEIAVDNYDGDFAPHLAFRDGLAIFSTSPRLTRQLVSATAKPDWAAPGVVSYGYVSNRIVEQVIDQFVSLTPMLAASPKVAEWRRINGMWEALEWTSTQKGDVTVSRLELR